MGARDTAVIPAPPLSTAGHNAVLEEMEEHTKGKERESCLNQTQALTEQIHRLVASPV